MAHEYEQHPEDFHLFGVEEYIDLVIDYIEHLRPDLVLERFVSQSPKELLIAPDWGLKNYEFNHRIQKKCVSSELIRERNMICEKKNLFLRLFECRINLNKEVL